MSKRCCAGENKKECASEKNKKDLVVGGPKKGGRGVLFGVAAVAVFALLAYAFFFKGGRGVTGGVQEVEAAGGVVKIPVSEVSDGKAHFYSYKADGKLIKFFVLKSSDGVIRSAFDACDVCYPEKKGYRQEGDHMVCNNCGMRFPSVSINVIKGGCNPSPVDRKLEGDKLLINVSDIHGGGLYF